MRILGSRFTTQSLLLLEKQSGQTLEMTADDCVWQTKTENGWRKVQPELLLQGAASLDAWQKTSKNTDVSVIGMGRAKHVFLKPRTWTWTFRKMPWALDLRKSRKFTRSPRILWIWSRRWFCRSQRNSRGQVCQVCGRWLGFWPTAAPRSIWISRWRCSKRRIWTLWEGSLEVHHARATWASSQPSSIPWWCRRIPSSRQSLE